MSQNDIVFSVYSSILCIPVWSPDGERVFSVSRTHQPKHLPSAVPLPGLSLWEQLFVHGIGSLCVPLLQTWRQHQLQITGLRMWWAPLRLFHIPSVLLVSKVWRRTAGVWAGVVCLGGMLYHSCVSSCRRSCRALSGTETCNLDDCAEGCGCPDGSYYDDVRQRCVQL